MTGQKEQYIPFPLDRIPSHKELVDLMFEKQLTPQIAEMILKVEDTQNEDQFFVSIKIKNNRQRGHGSHFRLKACRDETGAHIGLQFVMYQFVIGCSLETQAVEISKELEKFDHNKRFSEPDQITVFRLSNYYSGVTVEPAWNIQKDNFGTFILREETVPIVAEVLEKIQEYKTKAEEKNALAEKIRGFQP